MDLGGGGNRHPRDWDIPQQKKDWSKQLLLMTQSQVNYLRNPGTNEGKKQIGWEGKKNRGAVHRTNVEKLGKKSNVKNIT